MRDFVIIGGGLSGISCSYHLGHSRCIIFEKKSYPGGHVHTDYLNGFTWDEGPHVSFTKSDYVKQLFEQNVDGRYLEYPVRTVNYFAGNWIPHPAQSNLWAIPKDLRDSCLNDFLESRTSQLIPSNYEEWLINAFGSCFTMNFAAKYTRKYWQTEPQELSTDWVGMRVFKPLVEDVVEGYEKPLKRQTHYITHIRYPEFGGYFSFAKKMYEGACLRLGRQVSKIDLASKRIWFTDKSSIKFKKLISTLPLPELILLANAPTHVLDAANDLNCTSLLLVNVEVNHAAKKLENWLYVYDEDKLSTRINCTELLSPNNAPNGQSGIQVEVYFSKKNRSEVTFDTVAKKVCRELVEMGLIESTSSIVNVHTKWVQWANVVFDNKRRKSQDIVFEWLSNFGLNREDDDLEPMTNWDNAKNVSFGDIVLAGRFGQWKYFWTDDCILRGKVISDKFK